jgi:hypothetical protein
VIVNVEALCERYSKLKTDRSVYDAHCQEVAEVVLPRAATFYTPDPVKGEKRTDRVYDATAPLALEKFAAAMESLLTPRNSQWHVLVPEAAQGDVPDQEYQTWLELITRMLFRMRYVSRANFASSCWEVYMSLGAFGTGALGIWADKRRGIARYRHYPLSGVYGVENEFGLVDTVFRRSRMTLRQMAMQFGVENLSRNSQKRVEKEPDSEVEVLHFVAPRLDRDPTSLKNTDKAYASVWMEPAEKHKLSEGGFDTMPYVMSRYVTGANETYGRGPAMTVLPDIKMLNEMSKTTIRGAQMNVDPPLLIADDDVILPINADPGGWVVARMDGRTQMPVQALRHESRVDIGLEMMNQRRGAVNDSFLITLFQILVDAPQMTATEVLERAQEKGALLAPAVGRQQSEFLGPMIERELDVMLDLYGDKVPPPPGSADGNFRVEYQGRFMREQRAGEAVSILRTLEAVQPFAAFDPSVMDIFDPDVTARILADVNGYPSRALRDPGAVQQIRQSRAQAEQMAQMAQAAPGLAQAGKSVAETAQIARQGAI